MTTNTPTSIPAGITIKTAPHGAECVRPYMGGLVTDSESLLRSSCNRKSLDCKELLQSSFQSHFNQPGQNFIYSSSNGFVKGTIEAYNQHHHLVIRPEDVWFAILTQFSSYVNAHSEELRDKFVAHEGQKELEIKMVGTRYSVDFGWFAEEMGRLLEKNVVDPELREWILPSFTTTTREDSVVASVLMMGTLQKYFSYSCCIMCGLPSVTLLGTEGDWENILLRLEKLKTYGKEPTIWYNLLRPILARFVKSFQSPDSEEVLDFWQKVVHQYNMGSGPTYLSGWITAFCFFDENGKMLYRDPGPRKDKIEPNWNRSRYPYLELDGTAYSRIGTNDVPNGYSSVPVKVDDNGYEFGAMMYAGSTAFKGTSSGRPLDNGEVGLDTVQPVTGWWMFEKVAES